MAKIEYHNGTYDGNIVNDKPEDTDGSFFWKSDKILKEYHGSFKKGQFNGYGKLIFKDGFVQEGIFAQGMYIGIVEKLDELHKNNVMIRSIEEYPEGKVKISRKNKKGHYEYYEGDWYKGFRHGYGTHVNEFNHQITKGFFFNNKFIAKTFVDDKNNCVKLHNGTYSGNVHIEYPDGSTYHGKWVDGYRDGYGRYEYNNGDWYDGYWKKGLRHNDGYLKSTYYSKDSNSEYTGTFINDKIEGEGRIKLCGTMNVFTGFFKDGRKNGDGIQYYQNIGHCEGRWVDGLQTGPQYYSFEEIEGNDTELISNYDNNCPISFVFKNRKYSITATDISYEVDHSLSFNIDSSIKENKEFGKFIESIVTILKTNIFGVISGRTILQLINLGVANQSIFATTLKNEFLSKTNNLEIRNEKYVDTEDPIRWVEKYFKHNVLTSSSAANSIKNEDYYRIRMMGPPAIVKSYHENYLCSVCQESSSYVESHKEISYLLWD